MRRGNPFAFNLSQVTCHLSLLEGQLGPDQCPAVVEDDVFETDEAVGTSTVGPLYCKGVILIQGAGLCPPDPVCTLDDVCEPLDPKPVLRMLGPNVRSAKLLPAILPVPVTEGLTPTIVGGGVKTTRVPPPPAPPLMFGSSGVLGFFRTGETRTRPLPSLECAAVAVDIDDPTSSPTGVLPLAVERVEVALGPTSAARLESGACRGGSGVRGGTYPPIGPPLDALALELDDDDGIRKTGSPRTERPVAVALVDVVAELDRPRA